MELIKADIRVPFWCSFKDFGTVSSHLTYPFPTPPTIFGMILNSMGKPAIHYIKDRFGKSNTFVIGKIKLEYERAFSNMSFAVIITSEGEKIDDYANIHKRNRGSDTIDRSGSIKAKLLHHLIYSLNIESETAKKIAESISKYKIFRDNLIDDSLTRLFENAEKTNKLDKNITPIIIRKIISLWKDETIQYELNRYWLKTQITRQRLINPSYTIYIHSINDNEYSIRNIFKSLKNPIRPLYLGESDDIVDIKLKIYDSVNDTPIKSSVIHSIIPGIRPNSTQVCIPVSLREQENVDNPKNVYSIPKGDIGTEIDCFIAEGDRFVFI